MSFDRLDERVRRRVRDDGTVVDERLPRERSVEVDGGRIASLSPPVVRLRSGERVQVDAVVDGPTYAVGDFVVVVRRGGFVLAAKVRLV